MKKRYQEKRVYLVRWPDGVTKAGFTSEKRWRTFEIRGARVLGVWDFPSSANAFRCESAVDAQLWLWPLAWSGKDDVDDRLGPSKGGYMECHRVPTDVPDSRLQAMLTSIAHEHSGTPCPQAMHGRTGTEGRTDVRGGSAEIDRSGRNAHEVRA